MSIDPKNFPIQIISDVVCPWCYVGKKKLEKALNLLSGKVTANIEWRPFQLSPEIPEEGIDYKQHLIQKFGSERALDGAWQRLTELGNELGINFQFDKIPKAPNTLLLHTLVGAVSSTESQSELVEKLFLAHFSEGKDLTDTEVIWQIVAPYFTDRESFEQICKDQGRKEEIRKEISYYHQNGVSGVPYFIIGNKYAVSGAQNTEVFVEVIETVLKEEI